MHRAHHEFDFDTLHAARGEVEEEIEQAAATWADQEIARRVAAKQDEGRAPLRPVTSDDRSKNPLRPTLLDEVIGQEQAKRMMRRVLDATLARKVPLDHVLLVGASGTGKSTFSHVIANELRVQVFEVEAPVSRDTLLELREVARDRDILRIEEIHQQAVMERRGRSAATEPEVLYAVMEDRVIPGAGGLVDYPEITIIGTTTDEGMLPDPFINRFPLRPHLDPYTELDLREIARMNADKLGLSISFDAAALLAQASRGVPRQINTYVRNAALLCWPDTFCDEFTAREVLADLNNVTDDGLTRDMVEMLTFLYTKGRREGRDGDVSYQASVNTIATATGHSRDSKAIALRVEPYLIQRGYIQVGHGGRRLTDLGVQRARELIGENP